MWSKGLMIAWEEYKMTCGVCVCVFWCVSVCVCARVLGAKISRKRLEIEVRFQWDSNRKWHMADRLVTWPITSRDLERSRSWPRYIWMQISRKRLKIEIPFRWDTNRKWHMADRLVMWPMTSRDLQRSSSLPEYVWGPLSWNWLEIAIEHLWEMAPGESNGHVSDDVTWPWKIKVMIQIYLDANILKAVEDRGSAPSSATPAGCSILLIEWLYDRWRHVTV